MLCHYLYLSRITVTGNFPHSGIQSAIDIRIKCGFVFIHVGMSLNTSCDPCTRIDENTLATKWCVDCEDALCINCLTAHKGNRASMPHHVIDIEVISTLPGEVLTTQEKCSRHPDFIMNFFVTNIM
jgi:hypothetical protein